MKGVEVVVETVRFPKRRRLETLIKETEDFILKERPKGVGEGSGMAREVPDGPSGSFSSSSSESDDEIEDISSDDERSEADDTEKVDEADAKKADDSKKAEDEKDVEEHAMCHTP
ncbi:hypothetical protein Tco_0593513 [Tanacetum coccineum]